MEHVTKQQLIKRQSTVWRALRAAAPQTIPVLAGYFVLGMGYGIYVQSMGLPVWMPMLMGTGGNSGSQSSTAIIRSLSLGDTSPSDALRVIWKELRVAFLCGVSLAAANFIKMLLVDRLLLGNTAVTMPVAATVCCTIVFVVMFAKAVGSLLPMIAEKIGVDPAVMASPLISTITDARVGERELIRHSALHDGVPLRAIDRQVDHPVLAIVRAALFGNVARHVRLLESIERVLRPGAVTDDKFPLHLRREKPAAHLHIRQRVVIEREHMRAEHVKRAAHGRIHRTDHALIIGEPDAEIVVHRRHAPALTGELAADVDKIACVQVKTVVIVAVGAVALGKVHTHDRRHGRRLRLHGRGVHLCLGRFGLHAKTDRMLHKNPSSNQIPVL